VVAAATLAVAAVFQPARRRIQAVVDRRFNRRHGTARIVEGFGTRLRDQVDLDTLTTDLLDVVDQTMQPTQASLWLRPQGPTNATGGTVTHQLSPHQPDGLLRSEAGRARLRRGDPPKGVTACRRCAVGKTRNAPP
jgi:hypothetical protein